MIAIKTTYLGPTNTKGTRIKASDGKGHSTTISRNYENNVELDHVLAADELKKKMNWEGPTISGRYAAEPDSMYHVFITAP